VRSGEQIAKDMIAVRIGPGMRMEVVGAPMEPSTLYCFVSDLDWSFSATKVVRWPLRTFVDIELANGRTIKAK